jgi:hypothetical protein
MTTETLDPETEMFDTSILVPRVPDPLPSAAPQKPARAPRSDKGTRRPPKPATAAPAGVLSAEQGLTLRRLIDEQDRTRITLEQCERKFRDACARLNEFIDRISS